MSKMKIRLSIMEQGQVARVEELDSDAVPIKVGRLSSSHLRFEDPSVSRIHATLESGLDGGLYLIDLGSAAGTFVNGQKITKSAVQSGDELQFGSIVVRFELVDATPVAAPMPVAAAPVAAPQPVLSAPVASMAPPEDDFPGESTRLSPSLQQPADPVWDAAPAAPAAPAAQPAWEQPQATPQQDWYGGASAAPQVDASYAAQPSYPATVTTADGSQVEPFTLQGYYDDYGNYIPAYYDEHGHFHLGYGYYDEQGGWQVSFGYYNPQGDWVETPAAVKQGPPPGPSNRDYYTESFFKDKGGDTLEVAMIWHDQVIAVNSYTKARSVIIGSGKKSDFAFADPAIRQDPYPLIAFDGQSYSMTVTPEMSGVVRNGDQQYTIAEAIAQGVARQSAEVPGAYAIPLGSRTSARVDIGDTTFLAHFTDQPVFIGGSFGIDFAPFPYVFMSGVAHFAFLLLALTLPANPAAMEMDDFAATDRFVQLMITPEQEEIEEPDWMGDTGEEKAEAAKHKGDEGKAGDEKSEEVDKSMAVKGPSTNEEIQLKKAADTNIAMNSGALAVLSVSSPFGSANESIGSDAIHALGGLQGESQGTSGGFGGLGLADGGRGGGGISERGVGMANVGTSGRGGGGGGGSNYGRGASDLGEKSGRTPTLVPGPPQVVGSLDKEIIRRVVRQHRNEIRYCYETELQKNPKLAGQVSVKFTISGTGSVISALVSSSSLKNATTERCVTDKIRRWAFPEPKGGGIVVVTYPFNFSS